MYDKILAKWIANKISESQIDLLIKCGWLTAEEGNMIKSTTK